MSKATCTQLNPVHLGKRASVLPSPLMTCILAKSTRQVSSLVTSRHLDHVRDGDLY